MWHHVGFLFQHVCAIWHIPSMMAHHQVLWITSSRICIPNIGIFQGVSMEGKFPREQPKMDLSMPFAPIYFRDDLSLNYSIYSESKIENWLLFFNLFSQTCSFPWYVFFFHILFTDGKKEKCKKLSWKICTFFQQLFSESFSAIWQTFCGFAKLWKIVDWQKRKRGKYIQLRKLYPKSWVWETIWQKP